MAKVLELQHQSFQWIFKVDFLLINWFNLLSAQGALKSLLQHHSSKASVFWCSAFFMVQLSHPCMTTGEKKKKRSKGLLISWLQLPSAVILEPKKIRSLTVSIISPSICHEVMGPDSMILVFWILSFKPAFSTVLFYLPWRGSLVPPCFLP